MRDEATYHSLCGPTVFTTNGASGTGARFVRAFHGQGSRVGAPLAAKLGAGGWVARGDVTDAAALLGAIRTAAAALGPITMLINNFANDTREDPAEVTPELWRGGMAVNLDPAGVAAAVAGLFALGAPP